MVLDKKQTTVAYRCPKCGAGVLSVIDVFALNAPMVKLKCDCGGSEMTIVREGDGKVRLSVPCLLCPKPHTFLLNPAVFFGKEEFYLPCPYADINVCFLGDANLVKAELARTELELLDLMEKNGVENFSALHREAETLPDPEVREIVLYVVRELEAEGRIRCRCPEAGPVEEDPASFAGLAPRPSKYETEITEDGITVRCTDCGASTKIPTESLLDAHAFLYTDDLFLE